MPHQSSNSDHVKWPSWLSETGQRVRTDVTLEEVLDLHYVKRIVLLILLLLLICL